MNDEKISATQQALNAASPVMKSIAPVAASGAITHLLGIAADRRSQKYYKENQEALFHYSQLAQKNAASNEVEGLRKAGLSPALAQGASGMTTAAASASHQNPSAPASNPEHSLVNSNLMLNEKQGALLDSETALNESRKEGVDLDNLNKEGQNLTYATAYDALLDATEQDFADDPVMAKVVSALRANKGLLRNRGDYEALQQVVKYASSNPSAMANRLASAFESAVVEKQMANPLIASSVAIAPLLKNAETRARISEMVAMSAKLKTDADVNKELLPKLKQEVEWLGSEIAKNFAESEEFRARANSIHNSDVQTLFKEGDYVGVAANAIEGTAKLAGEAVEGYVAAKGYGKGFGKGSIPKTSLDDKPLGGVNAKGQKSHPLKAKSGRPLEPYEIKEALGDHLKAAKYQGKVYYVNGQPRWRDEHGNFHPFK